MIPYIFFILKLLLQSLRICTGYTRAKRVIAVFNLKRPATYLLAAWIARCENRQFINEFVTLIVDAPESSSQQPLQLV